MATANRRKELRIERAREANAVLDAMFAPPGMTFKQAIQEDQSLALVEDGLEVEKLYEIPEEWEDVAVNQTRYRNYTGKPVKLIPKMNFGSKLLMSNGLYTDIWDIVIDVFRTIHKMSPVKSGFYRSGHEIYVDNKRASPSRRPATIDANSFAFIINRVEYASTLETPEYSRPYQKAFLRANRKWARECDMRLEFAPPKIFGGNVAKRFLREPKYYQIPMLTIAPLNTLPQTGNFVFYDRRRLMGSRVSRLRWNPIALIRRLQKITGRM